MPIKIKYNPILYNDLNTQREITSTPWNMNSSNQKSLKLLSNKQIGDRLEFLFEYGLNGYDLENILRVHMPDKADSYVYWPTGKNKFRINFYKMQ